MNANFENANLLNAKISAAQLETIKNKCNMIHPAGYQEGRESRYKK